MLIIVLLCRRKHQPVDLANLHPLLKPRINLALDLTFEIPEA